jgi:AraC-like DNA-binding protein
MDAPNSGLRREMRGISGRRTPKRAARVIRFERVPRRIAGEAQPDWARLAAECGYSDQAHLIRDFGEFAGTTPGAVVRQSRR